MLERRPGARGQGSAKGGGIAKGKKRKVGWLQGIGSVDFFDTYW